VPLAGQCACTVWLRCSRSGRASGTQARAAAPGALLTFADSRWLADACPLEVHVGVTQDITTTEDSADVIMHRDLRCFFGQRGAQQSVAWHHAPVASGCIHDCRSARGGSTCARSSRSMSTASPTCCARTSGPSRTCRCGPLRLPAVRLQPCSAPRGLAHGAGRRRALDGHGPRSEAAGAARGRIGRPAAADRAPGIPCVPTRAGRAARAQEYSGIEASRLEQMEARLKADVLREAAAAGGRLLVAREQPHKGDPDGGSEVIDVYEPIARAPPRRRPGAVSSAPLSCGWYPADSPLQVSVQLSPPCSAHASVQLFLKSGVPVDRWCSGPLSPPAYRDARQPTEPPRAARRAGVGADAERGVPGAHGGRLARGLPAPAPGCPPAPTVA